MEVREMVALSAALVAAIIALSKLVADKETRVSDFRKEWIASFRTALGELLGQAYVISGRVRIRQVHGASPKSAGQAPPHATSPSSLDTNRTELLPTDLGSVEVLPLDAVADASASHVADSPTTDHVTPTASALPAHPKSATENAASDPKLSIAELEAELTSHWYELRKAHRAVLLHLNFSETAKPLSINRITAKQKPELNDIWKALVATSTAREMAPCGELQADAASKHSSAASTLLVAELETLIELLLGPYENVGGKERYEQIKLSIDKATLLGNLVIKPEWNRIKRGEKRYRVSLWIVGVVSILGILALSWLGSTKPTSAAPPLPTHQWIDLKR